MGDAVRQSFMDAFSLFCSLCLTHEPCFSLCSNPRGCHGEEWHCACCKYSVVALWLSYFACRANLTHLLPTQIDSVLLPYYYFYSIASLAVEVQDAVALTSLVTLVECAGLGEALDTTFGITVFAPTDDAFKGIDSDYYCGDGVDELVDILLYHVVPAVIPSTLIAPGKQYVETLLGESVLVTKKDDYVMVNSANVVVSPFCCWASRCLSEENVIVIYVAHTPSLLIRSLNPDC